jgi:hypothetical protein
MGELREVAIRVTRHLEDIDNARRKAEGHLHDTLYELTKYKEEMVVVHEKR